MRNLLQSAQESLGTTANTRTRATKVKVATAQPNKNSLRHGAARLIMSLILLMVMQGLVSGQTQTYNSNGTFVVPAGVTSVTVQAWGGGGGGRNGGDGEGGGGGGAFATSILSLTQTGSPYTVIVGTGGGPGTTGGNSSFSTSVVAVGGSSGSGDGGASGGLADNCTPSVGAYSGGSGGGAYNNFIFIGFTRGGGGGGSAYTNNTGGNGGSPVAGIGYANGGTGGTQNDAAGNGNAPGGGGGGRSYTYGTAGTGGNGRVVVNYTCPTYSLSATAATNVCTTSGTTSTVTLTSSAAGLPVGTYTVTYNRSVPAAMGLTAAMTVTTAGTGTFTATGFTTTGSSQITITNLQSSYCINAITANRTATIIVGATVPSQPSGITNNTPVCAGSSGIAYSVTNVANVTYTWSYSGTNASIASGQGTNSISVNYATNASSGTWTVTPSNTCGNGPARTLAVTVNTASTAPTSITGTTTICSGSTTTLTANGGILGTGGAYQWGTGSTVGSNIIAGATIVSFTTPVLTSTTTYWVRRVDPAPCNPTTGAVTVPVIVTPNASIASVTGATPLCIGGTSTYSPNTVVLGGGSGTWSSDNTSIATVNPSTGLVTAVANGTCNITYIISGGCGGIKTAEQPLTVVSPVGNPDVFGSNTWNVYAYQGNNIDLIGITYKGYYTEPNFAFSTEDRWGLNNSPSYAANYQGCTVSVDNHTFVHKRKGFPTGVYQITVGHDDEYRLFIDGDLKAFANGWDTGTPVVLGPNYALDANTEIEFRISEGGGGSRGALTFTSQCTTPDQPVLSASSTTICAGISTTLSINSGSLNSADHWQWYSGSCGGTPLGQGNSLIVSPTTTTTYYARGEGSLCDGTLCGSVIVNVNPSAAVGVSISANQSGIVCQGTSVTYTATPTNGGTAPTYQWKVNGSNVGINSSQFTYTPVDGDVVSCVITSNADCVEGQATSTIAFFSWDDNTKPLTDSDFGLDAVSIGGGQYVSGGIGGTTALAPKTAPTTNIVLNLGNNSAYNSEGIDFGIYYRRDESDSQMFTRGSSLIVTAGNNFSVRYSVANGAGGSTLVTSTNWPIPLDNAFHQYRFRYDPSDGIGRLFVDNVERWTSPTPTPGRPMYWNPSDNLIVGALTDATGRPTPTFDNLSLGTIKLKTATDQLTMTVAPSSTIAVTSASGTNAQTVCANTSIMPITYSTTGATGATVTNLPTGVTGSWSGNVVTISGTPTVAGATLTYTVALTGGCGTVNETGMITVSPLVHTNQITQP